ncbi:MAG TPA: DUF934 domain-containing protein [Caldimonas sp.]|nr:DUF934 domain-containing protein [Caldimonas sp.]
MTTAAMQFIVAEDDASPRADGNVAVEAGTTALIDWSEWLRLRADWPADLRASVALPNDLDIDETLADLGRFGRIALRFPKWTDGRAYSQARLLRVRHRFTGELRAMGDVIADMAAQLHRTGFDAAVLRPGESVEVAQRMLGLIRVFYQGDAHERRLRFARVEATA